MGFGFKALATKLNTAQAGATLNANILKGQGLDVNTVLTPAGKRKKRAGLVGEDKEEKLITVLGG